MEADWEVEIGPGAPVIDALWPGFIDQRRSAARIHEIEEARQLPALAEALVRLNSLRSPVWTSKCDVWPVSAEAIYPYELDATPEEAKSALACYLDLLPKSDQQWTTPAMTASACKSLCNRLHELPLSACRADLIVRLAVLAPDLTHHGVTAYLTACGPTAAAARQNLERALAVFTHAVSPESSLE